MNRKLFILPLAMVFLVGCTPTGNKEDKGKEEEEPIETTHPLKSISLDDKTLSIEEGSSYQLTYTIDPSNADNKNVSWDTSDAIIASVENGLVKAWNPGTADVSVITEDGNKTDTCRVTVTKKQSGKTEIDEKYNVNEQGYTKETIEIDGETLDLTDNFSAVFNKAEGSNAPIIKFYKEEETGKKYSIRPYAGNTFTISSEEKEMTKVSLVFSTKADDKNPLTVNTGSLVDNVWTGKTKELTYTVISNSEGVYSGHRAIQQIIISYEGQQEDDPDVVINLGEKSIEEVKDYIAEHPVKKNAYGNGVNYNRYVTIKGYALAKIDLIKSVAKYGLDVSEHGKVIMGDETGYIGVATKVDSQGTCLWGKVDNHQCKPTSKYVVTGYISEYLGHPELLVTSFKWDTTLDIDIDFDEMSTGVVSLTEFYEEAKDTQYNCAGHAYGEVVTIRDVKCYYIESDGQGKRYYNFTDGTNNIRVNAFNLSSASVGTMYTVTGIISIRNLSPIIVAFEIKSSQATPIDFNYEAAATSITVAGLRNIKGSQDDTDAKFPEVIAAYGKVFTTHAYMVAVEENGKIYVGISDTPRTSVISGKTNAMAYYGVVLIKNENFWNTTEEELYLFNPIYDDYLMEDNPLDVYYVTRQLDYSEKKACWQILLIPESIPEPVIE